MDNGYHHDTQDWTEGWFADMQKNGGVFGFYGPAWLINYTIAPNCGSDDNSSYGDWAVCTPNIGFFWGGTWVLASKYVVGSEKQDVVADIIKWITLDCDETSLQYYWANGTLNGEGGTKDTVASGTVCGGECASSGAAQPHAAASSDKSRGGRTAFPACRSHRGAYHV
jgi:hypothetical protein